MTQPPRVHPDRWKGVPNHPRPPLARQIPISAAVGVTVISPKYEYLAAEAVNRFRAKTKLDVIVVYSNQEPSFAAKLNLDLLVAPNPIVFFDADFWMLRPYSFIPLATSERFCAVPDPGAFTPLTFPYDDCEREGWDKEAYFNSGLFACDLRRPEIRTVFAEARQHLADCHRGLARRPADWTDQYFLNWAVRRHPGLFQPLPFALNFYKHAVDSGYASHIPRDIIGLHAAGIRADHKLHALRQQAPVFGPPES